MPCIKFAMIVFIWATELALIWALCLSAAYLPEVAPDWMLREYGGRTMLSELLPLPSPR